MELGDFSYLKIADIEFSGSLWFPPTFMKRSSRWTRPLQIVPRCERVCECVCMEPYDEPVSHMGCIHALCLVFHQDQAVTENR